MKGQITVKNIKTEKRGRMVRTMSTYDGNEQTSKTEVSSTKKEKDLVKTPKNTQSKNESEDDFFLKK